MSAAKSRVALEMSASCIRDPRMWTFTLPVYKEPREAAQSWAALQRALVRWGMWGLRVYEAHPGGHGLHVHVLTGVYMRVELVRSLCDRHGWGRVHIMRTSYPEYAAKYVAKDKRRPGWEGIRLWASFGVRKHDPGWTPSKVMDIEHVVPWSDAYESMCKHVQPKRFEQFSKLYRAAELCHYGLASWRIVPAKHYEPLQVQTIRDGVEINGVLERTPDAGYLVIEYIINTSSRVDFSGGPE